MAVSVRNKHDPNRDYASDMRLFEQTVKERLESLGEKDQYYLVL